MKSNWNLWFIAGVIVMTTACKNDVVEASSATISFVEPSVGDTLQLGEELHAEGTVQGNGEMHGYELSFTNLANGEVLYDGVSDAHAESYAFHEHWVNNVSDTSRVEVEIIAILDHEGHTQSKKIEVVCLP
jgi:hypothetical protein